MVVRPLPANKYEPRLDSDVGKRMLWRATQFWKTLPPMDVTVVGSTTDLSCVHPLKTALPREVTDGSTTAAMMEGLLKNVAVGMSPPLLGKTLIYEWVPQVVLFVQGKKKNDGELLGGTVGEVEGTSVIGLSEGTCVGVKMGTRVGRIEGTVEG